MNAVYNIALYLSIGFDKNFTKNLQLKHLFLFHNESRYADRTILMLSTIQKPNGLFVKGSPATFMPHKLATIVGIVKIIVMRVSTFITIFKLLEITDANASIGTGQNVAVNRTHFNRLLGSR